MVLNILIGGPQGGGIETAGLLALRALAMQGLEVFADREYHSNIKGKHSYSHIRASDMPIRSIKYPVDAIGALDVETLATHYKEIVKGGLMVHDAALSERMLTKLPPMDPERMERLRQELRVNNIGERVQDLDQWLESSGIRVASIPFGRILAETLKYPSPFIEKAMNTAITAFLLYSAGIQREAVSGAINTLFKEKKDVMDLNLKVAEIVNESAKPYINAKTVMPRNSGGRRLLIAGNDSVAIGKILGGLRLQTYYPITPAADESFALEQNSDIRDASGKVLGSPIVIQAEDEISAIGMAVGGALAGVRSATSTSGPGFSLMVEGLGWAGNSEVPIVVTMYQRGGPSTGLPTRHSQSDLLFSLFAGHGEFGKMVLASGDHREALLDAIKCMNYAETYQMPVIHLLDKGVANCVTTIATSFDYSISRGKRADAGDRIEGYKRFRFTDDDISPRAFLGEQMMWYTGDEHNESGHISEDPVIRSAMYDKRLEKAKKILEEAPDEDKLLLHGPDKYDDLIITWGITTGAALDALGALNGSGRKVSVMQIRMMEPFPSGYVSRLVSEADRVIAAEANYFGQLANIVEAKCLKSVPFRVLKYTGRLVTEDEIVSSYARIMKGEERIVLLGGE